MLPLTEEAESSSAEDDLFSVADIKLEVMRARGAGGQVTMFCTSMRTRTNLYFHSTLTKQNLLSG